MAIVTKGDNCNYVNLTSGTATVKSGIGQLYGIIVNSHTSGSLKIYNSLTAGTGSVVCSTMTFASGERFINLAGITFPVGCSVAIVDADVTICYS